MATSNLKASLRLVAVTDPRSPVAGLVSAVTAAVRGGASLVQVRRKDLAPAALVDLVRTLITAVAVPVVVNDDVAVALAAGAAGVHLGSADLPVGRVRAIVPPGFVIGASVGTLDEIEAAKGADYWGVGPWRATATKPDAGTVLDPEAIAGIAAAAGPIPWVAIGAVRPEDVPAALAAGASGVAVVSGLFGDSDPAVAAANYRARLEAVG